MCPSTYITTTPQRAPRRPTDPADCSSTPDSRACWRRYIQSCRHLSCHCRSFEQSQIQTAKSRSIVVGCTLHCSVGRNRMRTIRRCQDYCVGHRGSCRSLYDWMSFERFARLLRVLVAAMMYQLPSRGHSYVHDSPPAISGTGCTQVVAVAPAPFASSPVRLAGPSESGSEDASRVCVSHGRCTWVVVSTLTICTLAR